MFDLTGVEGFLFDCDGTLLDSLDAWERVEAPLFKEAGNLTNDEKDEIHGAPIAEAARIFHERYGVLKSTDAVLHHLDSGLIPFYQDEVKPLPGAIEFVSYVHESGIPALIVTSSPLRYVVYGIERVGLSDCFIDIISTEEVQMSKQNPLIYQKAAEELGLPYESLWAVDDAYYALKAMKEAGLHTISVGAKPAYNPADLRRVADVAVDSLTELL